MKQDATNKPSSWDAVKHAHTLDGDALRLKDYYGHWADRYDEDVKNEQYAGPNYIAELVKRVSHDPATPVDPAHPTFKILDAGCGTGLVGKELSERGFQYIDGFDISTEMADRAEDTGAYRSVRGEIDLTQPIEDYPDDQYDVTVSCGVFTLGHVPPESLLELVRVTKPNGLVVISTRNSYCERSGFASFCENLEREDKVKLLVHVPNGPYIEEEGAQYWVFSVAP